MDDGIDTSAVQQSDLTLRYVKNQTDPGLLIFTNNSFRNKELCMVACGMDYRYYNAMMVLLLHNHITKKYKFLQIHNILVSKKPLPRHVMYLIGGYCNLIQ